MDELIQNTVNTEQNTIQTEQNTAQPEQNTVQPEQIAVDTEQNPEVMAKHAKVHSLPAVNRVPGNISAAGVLFGALLVVLCAAMPMMNIWFGNQGEVPFIQAFVPAAAFILLGLIIFFLILAFTKRPSFSGVISAIAIFILADFSLIRELVAKFFAEPTEQYVSIAVAVLIIIGLFVLLFKIMKENWLGYVTRLAAVFLAGIMLISFFLGVQAAIVEEDNTAPIPTVSIVNEVSFEPQPTPTPIATITPQPVATILPEENTEIVTVVNADGIIYADPAKQGKNQPNIYCFILDEYAPPAVTKKYYGYDNSKFVKFLEERRFNFSSTSLCNIAETSYCVGELHRLEPFNSSGKASRVSKATNLTKVSPSQARSYRKSSAPLYQSFRNLGYNVLTNCAWSKLFPADQLKNNQGVLVDLSGLVRTPRC